MDRSQDRLSVVARDLILHVFTMVAMVTAFHSFFPLLSISVILETFRDSYVSATTFVLRILKHPSKPEGANGAPI